MIAWIANLLGQLIRVIYNLVGNNYILSIIIFTILTKLILLPLFIKQTKSMENIKNIGPDDKKIREKYKNDKQKMNEELTKLYAENKVNPVGGCLPMLIQIPLIFAMLYIVRQPLTYIAQTPVDQIQNYAKEMTGKENISVKEANNMEIEIANKYNLINMENFGINFGKTPSNVFSKEEDKKANPVLLVVPVLSLVFSIIQIRQQKKNSTATKEQEEMQKSMNMTMPFLSAIISYTMPVALGIYWLLGSIISILQQYIVNKYVLKIDSTNIKDTDKKKILKIGSENKDNNPIKQVKGGNPNEKSN